MIGVKRQPLASPQPVAKEISGKYVILAVLAVAFIGAAASWFFRYNATHRAAEYWGPEAAQLIRDAPQVKLVKTPLAGLAPTTDSKAIQATIDSHSIDISHARGLLHLRNALLEDANFNWTKGDEPPPQAADDILHWWLNFNDPASGKTVWMTFSENCRQVTLMVSQADGISKGTPISTEPIAKGLREIFAEFSEQPASNTAESSR